MDIYCMIKFYRELNINRIHIQIIDKYTLVFNNLSFNRL
jgi:hypothetical protein